MRILVKSGNQEIEVKEYKGQRVVTFKDIDLCHERPEGTAKRNFHTNSRHFIEGEDYFKVCSDEIRTNKIFDISSKTHRDVILITAQGYMMLVKSFTDDLAWAVQRELVNNYFKAFTYATTASIKEQAECVEIAARMLNTNEAGKIIMLKKFYKQYGLPCDFLPDYVSNGNREYRSATVLQKERGYDMSSRAFNLLLLGEGFLEERTRPSKSKGKKKYKALTEKGLQYGENLVSPENQREVQPVYYVDRFDDLFQLVTQTK